MEKRMLNNVRVAREFDSMIHKRQKLIENCKHCGKGTPRDSALLMAKCVVDAACSTIFRQYAS